MGTHRHTRTHRPGHLILQLVPPSLGVHETSHRVGETTATQLTLVLAAAAASGGSSGGRRRRRRKRRRRGGGGGGGG